MGNQRYILKARIRFELNFKGNVYVRGNSVTELIEPKKILDSSTVQV